MVRLFVVDARNPNSCSCFSFPKGHQMTLQKIGWVDPPGLRNGKELIHLSMSKGERHLRWYTSLPTSTPLQRQHCSTRPTFMVDHLMESGFEPGILYCRSQDLTTRLS
ncbi:hypothetical protein AVEN_146414-1 [Araneus ventricosus]|uniref:Uncharacterized protein n=1 Tax=Araneus ventricosus TaxID=182803 RepID=A0A4Y2AFB8_ARAVE|nr:hypothetical protein AVEN_146414-1 [Araneus ventricosus]